MRACWTEHVDAGGLNSVVEGRYQSHTILHTSLLTELAEHSSSATISMRHDRRSIPAGDGIEVDEMGDVVCTDD